MDLSKEQKIVVDFISSNIAKESNGIINAVAGSGKTSTLLFAIQKIDSQKQHVTYTYGLYCAFNKSVQQEVHNKLVQLLPNRNQLDNDTNNFRVDVNTIHSLGRKILQRYLSKLGKSLPEHPKQDKYAQYLKDDDFANSMADELAIIKSSMKDADKLCEEEDDFAIEESYALPQGNTKLHKHILRICHYVRVSLTELQLQNFKDTYAHFMPKFANDIYDDMLMSSYLKIISELLYRGENEFIQEGNIDYTDMVYLPYRMKLNAHYQYEHVFIDECQDLSKAQINLVQKFAKNRVLAVGDPYQSIYGFSGADSLSYENVAKSFATKQLDLDKTFRCPTCVAELAKEINDKFGTSNTNEGKVKTINFDVLPMLAQSGDMIIARRNDILKDCAATLIRAYKKVSYRYGNAYIQYLRKLFSKIQDESICQANHTRFIELINDVVKDNISEPNLTTNINFIIHIFYDVYPVNQSEPCTIKDLLNFIAQEYVCDKDAPKEKQRLCIELSTIHRAKGLEADRVFILDWDNLYGSLHELSINKDNWQLRQEVNLLYVAITRSKDQLYLVKECYSDIDYDDIFDESFNIDELLDKDLIDEKLGTKEQFISTKSHMEKEKEKHLQAYSRWTVEHDEQLKQLVAEGKTIREIMEITNRGYGGIKSRITKLHLRLPSPNT